MTYELNRKHGKPVGELKIHQMYTSRCCLQIRDIPPTALRDVEGITFTVTTDQADAWLYPHCKEVVAAILSYFLGTHHQQSMKGNQVTALRRHPTRTKTLEAVACICAKSSP